MTYKTRKTADKIKLKRIKKTDKEAAEKKKNN